MTLTDLFLISGNHFSQSRVTKYIWVAGWNPWLKTKYPRKFLFYEVQRSEKGTVFQWHLLGTSAASTGEVKPTFREPSLDTSSP
jgi:hypothetical protein